MKLRNLPVACILCYSANSYAGTVEIDDQPWAIGQVTEIEYSSLSAGAQLFPARLEYTGVSTSNRSVRHALVKIGNLINGTIIPLATPEPIWETTAAAGPFPRDFSIYAQYIAWANTEARKYGKFRFEFEKKEGGVSQGFVYQKEFIIDGTFNPNDGNLNFDSVNDTITNQPINQGSFWQTVFGPTEAGYDALLECTAEFSTWGPLNVYSEITELIPEGDAVDYSQMNFGMGPTDLSMMTDFFRGSRMLMAASFWIAGIMFVWKSTFKAVASS